MKIWKDEGALWEYLVPRLRGKWTKLEAEYPPGVSDSFGLWKGQTHWLEHKIGKPHRMALESGQVDFGFDCARHDVPWWVCFGWKGKVWFFDHPAIQKPKVPPFWVTDSVTPRSAAPLPRTRSRARPLP